MSRLSRPGRAGYWQSDRGHWRRVAAFAAVTVMLVLASSWAVAQAADGFGRPFDTERVVHPLHQGFHDLMVARKQMRSLRDLDWPPIPSGPSIHPEESDDRIPLVADRLALFGDFIGEDSHKAETRFTAELVEAVERFQLRHGLEADGVIGRRTLSAMNVTPRQRLDTIDVNLERWHWLPEEVGPTRVQVNIAGFELQLIVDGELRSTHRVVVGKPYRSTPLFSDEIRYLEFNPTWTVPFKLMVEDLLPVIQKDPDYLRREGFVVYQGHGADLHEVDPETVDWWDLSHANFPYQLVQQPGPRNALGRVKFMFPNRFSVYLHDTPAKSLFWRSRRTFSSGCIRVERPFELAQSLLTHNGHGSAADIRGWLAPGRPRVVHLAAPVPIYLEYWTSWADPDGTLHFRDDIYGRDGELLDSLTAHPADPSDNLVKN